MTVVSFATSAPELIVSLKAALNGAPDLALGNVIGSNIANLGFVLGVTLLFGAMKIQKSFYQTDWPVMMLASGLLFEEDLPEVEAVLSVPYLLFYLGIGGVGLWAGSELLVAGAKSMAQDFGVSQRVIGVTVVSVGTSIPELSASIIAVIKKEKAISLGNLIGSNIFNILAVLGITSIVTPVAVSDLGLLSNDIFWMLGVSFLILPFVLLPKRFQLNWKHGFVLLLLYGIFIYRTL